MGLLVPFPPLRGDEEECDLCSSQEAGPGVGVLGAGLVACPRQGGPWVPAHDWPLAHYVLRATLTCLGRREAVLKCTEACAASHSCIRGTHTGTDTHTWHHHGVLHVHPGTWATHTLRTQPRQWP